MKIKELLKIMPFVALVTLSACGGGEKEKKATETAVELKKVRVQAAEIVSVSQSSTFTATVEANMTNNIAPAIPGRIRKILVDVGSYVRKGQPLITMDGTNLSQQQTQIATLKRDYERYQELYEVGGISKQQLDQLKSQLDVAQSALNNLSENTTLRSPISGLVTARNFDPGDMAGQMPILTVENINPVKVLVNISESFYTKVSVGMPAKVTIDVLKNEEYNGKVSLIHPTINAMSHTFAAEVSVANSNNRLRPGMFARVTMNFGEMESIMLPDAAVMKQTGSNDRYVFIIENGKTVKKMVEVGQHLDSSYQILSGINTGDNVVIAGASKLMENEQIKIVQ